LRMLEINRHSIETWMLVEGGEKKEACPKRETTPLNIHSLARVLDLSLASRMNLWFTSHQDASFTKQSLKNLFPTRKTR